MSYIENDFFRPVSAKRLQRQHRLWRARMCSDRLPEHEIMVRNISSRGIGANSRATPPIVREAVLVTLPHGELAVGTVRWVDGCAFGIEIDRELDLEAVAAAMERQARSTTEVKWEVRGRHRVAQAQTDPTKLRSV